MAQKYSEMKLMENAEAGELNAESDTSKDPVHQIPIELWMITQSYSIYTPIMCRIEYIYSSTR